MSKICLVPLALLSFLILPIPVQAQDTTREKVQELTFKKQALKKGDILHDRDSVRIFVDSSLDALAGDGV